MKKIASITSLGEYVSEFSDTLAKKVADECEPIYNDKDGLHPRLSDIKTKPFAAQAKRITACVMALKENRLVIDAGRMGVGKTMQSISTTHALFDGKPYRALVMCPSHLVEKWVDEVHKFLGHGVIAVIIHNWREFMQIDHAKPTIPTWYIIAQTTAKLGYARRAATVQKRRKIVNDLGATWQLVETCPKCCYTAMHGDAIATKATVERLQLKCTGMYCKKCCKPHHHSLKDCPICGDAMTRCGEPLTQAYGHKVSPCQYAKAKSLRIFDIFIRDEAHISKSANSIDGHACSVFASLAKYRILLTGTLLAGKSEDLRPLLFRLMPGPFIEMGYGWKDELQFAERYGRIQTVVRTSSGGAYESRKHGKGSSKSTSRDVKPGIMPYLYPDFVANYTVFMSIHDVATDLPSYEEITVPVEMDAVMAAIYDEMQKKLLQEFRDRYARNRKDAAKLLGPMLETLMTWPDVPYGRKPVCIDNQCILIPPTLPFDNRFAKEQKLIETLLAEKKAKRKCWVYSDRDDTRERLVNVMESHGLRVAHLEASVKASTRIEWLKKYGPHCDVGICNPTLVETGMELFGPGFNFPSLIWYSTGWRLNTLRQASMRSFRIGQKMPCKTMYLYYDKSAQQKAIAVMASKLVAAEAIEGKFSDEGLANEAIDEDIAMEIARSLADNITLKVKSRHNPIESGCTAQQRAKMLQNWYAEYMLANPDIAKKLGSK